MRFAYADPPYVGCAGLYPEKEEVDEFRMSKSDPECACGYDALRTDLETA